MKTKIEELFGGDLQVPGMRPPGGMLPRLAVSKTRTSTFPVTIVAPWGRPALQLLSAHNPRHSRSERIRLLRTELQLRHTVRNDALAIAVLGAKAGEGRSQLAAELALSFAQLNRSTLLLDADLRHPRQHALFGIELRDGLAQVILRGEPPAFHGIEGYPTFSLMTAGLSPSNPLELLSDGRFDSLIDELRHMFEVIIVDTPRCSDYADGLVIASVVGHVFTVYRSGHTPYKAARSMLRQLVSAQANILGGVVNHF